MRPVPLALLALAVTGVIAVGPAVGAPEQSPRRGGTVVHGGAFGEPACFTPGPPTCAPGSTLATLGFIAAKVLAQPFEVGPDLTWQPELVSSWTVRTKPPFTVTYRIQPDARWSDGVPVTADDFVFSHNALLKLHPADSAEPHLTVVRSVRGVDRKTVRIVLKRRFAEWRGLFGPILPAHALRGRDLAQVWKDGIEDPRTGRPIGSGPFLFESWDRGRQIVLRRNPRYWGPHPAYVDRVVVRFGLTLDAAREALRRGELDVVTHFPPTPASELAKESGMRLLSNMQGVGWDHLEFRLGSGGHPALRSKLVRRAIAYGIDRRAIVRLPDIRRVDSKAVVRESAVFPRMDARYRPNWQRYTHRPALARRLLAQAGCTRGDDGIAVCDGRRLSFRLATTVIAGGFRPAVVEAIQTQLRQVGVEIVPEYYPQSALFNGALLRGDFDIVLFAWLTSPDRASAAKGIFGCAGDSNRTGYCQRLVTAELDQATRVLDRERQADALNRADLRIASDVPALPLYQQTQTVVVRSTLRNFGLALSTQSTPLWNAEDWWLAEPR